MTTFKVMTWNVENLFRPEASASAEEQLRYQQKLALLARVINKHRPDVVGLQEVGGAEPLGDVQHALGGTYPHSTLSGFPDARGIRVAFLSRHAVAAQPELIEFPPGPALSVLELSSLGDPHPIRRMGRGAAHIRVVKAGATIDLITVHLKSKLLSFPRPNGTSFTPRDETERSQVAGIALHRRTAEAVTVRMGVNALLEQAPEMHLLVLGDFNDVPEAQTSLIFTGPPGSEIGTPGFDQPDAGDRFRLFNVAARIPKTRRFSRKHHGQGELLDQVFASAAFFPLGPDSRRRLPTADSHIHFEGPLPSVGDNPGARVMAVGPDHAPVTATFRL